jgi:hypothetical protein
MKLTLLGADLLVHEVIVHRQPPEVARAQLG